MDAREKEKEKLENNFLFSMIGENLISKISCERNSVISACRPFLPDAFISFLFTSRALIVQLVAHLYLYFNFFKYEAWLKEGGEGEEEKKIRGRDSRKGKAHGGTVTRLLRCPGEIAMVIPSSLSESSLKQKLTFDPSTRNAKAGKRFPCLLYNFRIFAHIPFTRLGKINRKCGTKEVY